ncbi:hypothetical protein OH491_23765 [Termitidicoccus mucosus]|uniref:hypothetical protein n=1 Tax=Termitidicoccus mucosus TaxID=1184151 RepID=UPI002FEE16B7
MAKFRLMGDTALQAGNSESIIRHHYLNVTTSQEAGAFFAILPKRVATPQTEPAPQAASAPAPMPASDRQDRLAA